MQLHRRSFLCSLATGACYFSTQTLSAADQIEPFTFVIVSDTHLGRQDKKSAEVQWRTAITEINQTKADFVLHLGDVVDGGRPEQYPIYAETRKQLKKPIHEIPGNHDPVELFEKHIIKTIDRVFDHQGVRFLLFNNAHTDSHLGFITPEQLKWLATKFKEGVEKGLRLVVGCHVPIHTNTSPDRAWYVKPADGQTGFYELLDKYRTHLLACFHGHFHNGIRGWRDHGQVVEVLCPSVCYNQSRKLEEALKAQKTTGFFVEELRPGYVIATLGRGKLTMTYKPLKEETHGEYVAEWK